MSDRCFLLQTNSTYEALEAGVGAMYWRYHERKEYDHDPRPLPHLAVLTPGGIACLDCPADKEPHAYWTRSGEPPDVTVSPSLDVGPETPTHWHGFLVAGQLNPC